MTPPQVVGTDLIFGLVLAVIGGHFIGSLVQSIASFWASFWPAEYLGFCLDADWRGTFPREKLKLVIAAIAIFAGVQLVWNGTRTLLANRAVRRSKWRLGTNNRIAAIHCLAESQFKRKL